MATAELDSFASIATSQPPSISQESLPSAQSSDLKLDPASLLEYVQTAYLNADEWKGPLTIEQYLQREDLLQATTLTKSDRITGWILTTDSLPTNSDGSRPILASCESIAIHAYAARDGVVEKIQAHGIASVYNRPEHRGKGYASRMMAELAKRLESWQSTSDSINKFSVLFSDIGQTFYARHGWQVSSSTHIHLHPIDQNAYDSARSDLPGVDELLLEDLRDIPAIEYLEHRLQKTSQAMPGKIHVAIRPDLEHFEWHFARDEFQTKMVGRRFPKVKGAIHRPTGIALIWCRVYAAKPSDWQLHILHTVVPPSVEGSESAELAVAALLLKAQLEAHVWEMASGVEVWDPCDVVMASAQRLRGKEQGSVEIITRDREHLCSLRWAPGITEDVVWLAKEKYGWC